ncbi:acetylglutamate kinase [Gammaproteobacteria bacterium]|nr:acetylglutamate kinase [Gammaproteobacteria bacterium]
MQALIDKAAVLVEALPWIRRLTDKTIVIKYGGHAMSDRELRASFAVDVVLLKYIGVRPVIVHGGGPQIDATLEKIGKKSIFVDGRRVTDDETMEVVEMILGGTINQEIVGLVQQGGGRAIGLTGRDGGLLRVRRKLADGRDLGRVGDPVGVDAAVVNAVADAGYVPVIAPIGVDTDGVTYNVNADEAAGAVAAALRAEKLILLTDVEGVKDRDGRVLRQLTVAEVAKHLAEGAISGGMIPKVECCVDALRGGVSRTHIVDGRMRHAVLLEIFTDAGVGTLIGR